MSYFSDHLLVTPFRLRLAITILASVALFSMCGSPPAPQVTNPPIGTNIDVTFSGPSPVAVAVRLGSRPWQTMSIVSGHLHFTVPNGIPQYAIAVVCPPVILPRRPILQGESVFEATIGDAVPSPLFCSGSGVVPGTVSSQPTPTQTVSGTVDASAIPNVAQINVFAGYGFTSISGATGVFTYSGTGQATDIGFAARDGSGTVIAVNILRWSGATTGGVLVAFSPQDVTSSQSLAAFDSHGFSTATRIAASYITANGTWLCCLGSTATPVTSIAYPAISANQTQPGDAYCVAAYGSQATVQGFGYYGAGVAEKFAPARSVTLTLPEPLGSMLLASARFPNFAITYPGFPHDPTTGYSARIFWAAGSNNYVIRVVRSVSFQNGNSTLTIPDLSTMSGFFAPASTGTTVYWENWAYGGSSSIWYEPGENGNDCPQLSAASGATWVMAESAGTYIEP